MSQIMSHSWMKDTKDFRLVECNVIMDESCKVETPVLNVKKPEAHGQKVKKRMLSGSSTSSVTDARSRRVYKISFKIILSSFALSAMNV